MKCVSTGMIRAAAATVSLIVGAMPLLPATTVVPANGDFQAALNKANPGDTIILQSGARYTGNFTLPNKSGTSPITITSSAVSSLPAGVRVGPGGAVYMPKVVSPNSSPALATADGAHNYIVTAIEFVSAAGVYSYEIVRMGSSSATSVSQLAHDIHLDRLYVHGDPAVGAKRGLALNSVATKISNSYISDIKSTSQDAQAIAGWNGPGPFTITNNYLEASGENIMFGGAKAGISNLVPSDIQINQNYIRKPLSWKPGDPSYAGTPWLVKNLLELKNAQRVTINGNVLENNWKGGQNGYGVLFTVRTESGAMPWAVVQNVTFTSNILRNSPLGINLLGKDNNGQGKAGSILIRNNLFVKITDGTVAGNLFQILEGVNGLTIDHNTAPDNGQIIIADGAPDTGVSFTNNIVLNGLYGIAGSGLAPGNASIAYYFPSGVFTKNVMVGGNASIYPPNNYFPSSVAQVGFVNASAGDYHLMANSPYHLAGTDGKDIGADIDALNKATANTVSGSGSAGAPPVVYLVNSGGPDYTDPAGLDWGADAYYTGGSAAMTSMPIAGTATPALYQRSRVGTFSYQFPVANGVHRVALKFAENDYNGPGQRVFNVLVNGQKVLAAFDPYAQAGGKFIAVDRKFTVSVTTGQIVISFVGVVAEPSCSAVAVY